MPHNFKEKKEFSRFGTVKASRFHEGHHMDTEQNDEEERERENDNAADVEQVLNKYMAELGRDTDTLRRQSKSQLKSHAGIVRTAKSRNQGVNDDSAKQNPGGLF